MKRFEFKGKEYNCPECWEEVTLTQLLKINTGLTRALEAIQVCTGIDEKELGLSNEFALIMQIDKCLAFLAVQDGIKLELEPKEIVFNGVKVSPFSDIGTKSIVQFKDMEQLVFDFHTIEGEEIDVLKRLSLYPKIVATYLQPFIDSERITIRNGVEIKGEYDFQRVDELAIELYNHSAVEVSNWGHFFIQRFHELRSGIVIDANKSDMKQKRRRRDSLSFLSRWAGKLYYILYLRGISKGKTI
jgi:hypothetical protein